MEKSQMKALLYEQKNGNLRVSPETVTLSDAFSDEYKKFLDGGKTEREAVKYSLALLENAGFSEFSPDKKYSAGDKVYYNNRGKSLIAAVFGKEPVENGTRIIAAHIDSPRLDLKPNPLYETDDIAYFKTHYYGGIKKYQWPTVPLAIHGVFCKTDGTVIDLNIGENDGDPKFMISDILPHLASEQYKRTLPEGIKAEELNIIVGSKPVCDDEEGLAVKLGVLKILNEKYGVTENDFLSAEIECVPAGKSFDVGFDRSMIGSYGHDDRVCAYPALRGIIDMKDVPDYTSVCVLTDKEEIGSEGNTGLKSEYLKYFIYDLATTQGGVGRRALMNSKCLSADVNAAYDPTFADAFEKRNASLINYGTVVTKYTGSRGKSSTSDASAEYTTEIRAMLDKAGIVWQQGELGKVDIGGGGTVAKYLSNLGIDVIDLGVPVLSMHSPCEIVAKLDVYMTYLTAVEFYKL